MGAAAGVGTLAGFTPTKFAIGQQAKVRVGTLLPYSGTYARLGEAITNAMQMRFAQSKEMIGSREIELIKLDSEAAPPKATENTSKLINSEKVDFLVGPVHSGVAMAMAKIAREEGVMTIIPNAGADQITGPLCAPNIFRSSFSNWQPGYPMGRVLGAEGKKRVVLCYWNYGAGQQSAQGFKDGFAESGGEIIKEIGVPFPEVEFQSVLSEIASLKPDAVYTFFAGGGAVKFVKDWAAAGLKDSGIELTGSGFLTEGVTEAQGAAAEGLRTTLHYADTLDNDVNNVFRRNYKEMWGSEADVYAVQGYDAAEMIRVALEATDGDTGAKDDMIKAIENTVYDSPRGPFKLSAAHNPVQNFYLRKVVNGVNEVQSIAVEALSDPAKGCRLG
ncbi:ABC transporter substrate-binding protein [Marivibrio halodurans]|uniref:ABC transporter substrate-binding protein n=2 Tax=Marivibrio halodurans TaxID=2039722 RepID=A0A8J7S0Z1_9PROT|nr:ABC transporter substrate-binding protein [Marivibrio halodurans]MBP5856633.1 ABC transporter substrate-binding protein [Marivibrio halodurans]